MNSFNVLNRLLDVKVELAVGEVIGVSREISSMLADSIKLKSAKSHAAVGLATQPNQFRAKTRAILIKVQLECNGEPVEAIIDTGSQLNLVSERFYKSAIKQPLNTKEATKMNDANGGSGNLSGMVENVRLDYGTVITRANLYVGEQVPFDLLLGRPWQRGNYVTIDELEEGTYLVFKDPKTMEPKYLVLVSPDGVNPKWDHEPATWMVAEAPMSLLIELEKEVELDGRSTDLDRPRKAGEKLTLVKLGSNDFDTLEADMLGMNLGDKIDQLNLGGGEGIKSEEEGPRSFPNINFLHTSLTSQMPVPSISVTRAEENLISDSSMEMRLMPARVRHENVKLPRCSRLDRHVPKVEGFTKWDRGSVSITRV